MTFKDYCAKHGIEIKSVHLGVRNETEGRDKGKPWTHDAFEVILTAKGVSGELITSWKQGIGHRTWGKVGYSWEPKSRNETPYRFAREGSRLTEPAIGAAGRRLLLPSDDLSHPLWTHWTKPSSPRMEDVLQSIAMDSSCADEGFETWCQEFGYDEDSRHAERVYRACQDQARKARKWLGAEKFRELLECTEE